MQGKISPDKAGAFSRAEVIVKEHSAVSRLANRVTSEEPGAQAISFVVRIWRQTEPAVSEYRGWVEHVQSGQRTSFLGLDQLSSVIAAHIGIPIRQGVGWRNRLTRWRARVAAYLVRADGG